MDISKVALKDINSNKTWRVGDKAIVIDVQEESEYDFVIVPGCEVKERSVNARLSCEGYCNKSSKTHCVKVQVTDKKFCKEEIYNNRWICRIHIERGEWI